MIWSSNGKVQVLRGELCCVLIVRLTQKFLVILVMFIKPLFRYKVHHYILNSGKFNLLKCDCREIKKKHLTDITELSPGSTVLSEKLITCSATSNFR